jgi:chromosome segregation ATPase
MGTLETNFATLDGKVNREIDQISGDVASFDNRIRTNTTAIADLAEVVNRKANKSDLDNLTSTVGTLANALDGKVNITEYDTYKSRIAQQFNDMDNVKADKSSVVAAMSEIAAVDGKVAQEKVDRIAADALLQGLIDSIEDEIVEIKEGDVHEDERIDALEDGLAQEIADRQQGDLDLIGATSDTKNDDTIWGAKRFAQDQKGIAISEAATYTNEEIAGIRHEFEDDFENIERELTAKADTTYVDASRNELRQTLEEEFNTAIEAEKTRAQVQETQLNAKVNLNTADIRENDTKITNLATKVKCITEWEGTDPQQYDDSGNGILDVLHREFHEFASTAGSIRNVRVEDGNLIITYITPTGDTEVSTPLTSIFDANAYYDKTATDELLAGKADVTALTDAVSSIIGDAPAEFNDLGKMYEHVTANTQSITTANANIAENAANIDRNTQDIATANDNIAQNTADIASASTAIAQNASDIDAAEAAIAQNASDIDAAEAAIATATTAIAQNASDIDAAEAAIATASTAIAQNAADIDAAEAAITAAQTAIQSLDSGATEIEAELATKADQAAMETALAAKADKTYVEIKLSEKVSRQTFDNAMVIKADSDVVNALLEEKVNKNEFNLQIQLLQDQIDELKRIISGGTANP